MSNADRPATPPDDLVQELHAHDREFRAIMEARQATNRRHERLRDRARLLAARMLRAGVGTVEVDGWLIWPNADGSGLHRRSAPTAAPAPGVAAHG